MEPTVDIGEQSAVALIGTIKSNASLTEAQALEVIGQFYPETECGWRLEAYETALYKVGGISEVSWILFRDYIYSASMETLGLILPQIRVIADIEIMNGTEIRMTQMMIASLEEQTAGGDPTKTKPDIEAMEFYNTHSMAPEMYEHNMIELARLKEWLENQGE